MEMTEVDRAAVVETFLAECEEQFAAIEEAVVALEEQPEDEDLLQSIFRLVHTLKGNSVSLGLSASGRLAHALEDLLDRLRTRTLHVSPRIVTLVLRAVDALRGMIPEELETGALQDEHKALLGELEQGRTPGPSGTVEGSKESGMGAPHASKAQTLRVDVRRLDRMLDLSGEIAIARGRLARLIASIPDALSSRLVEAQADMDRLYMDLQEELLGARTVFVGPTFRQHARTVRDVALQNGKGARIVVEGEDVEVDTAIIEGIRAPLTHLVRNAVDHGIEFPDERRALGKNPEGRITLRASYEPGHVLIEVIDDGRGLDRERILARARERGLLGPSEQPSENAIDRLIFEAGFSTAASVSELSGRGIGMDVVRKSIEALRGTVSVQSVSGKGMTVSLRLPLTLAIIQGFLVSAAGETYVIPLDSVLECVDLDERGADTWATTGLITLRGEAVPYVRLRAALGFPEWKGGREAVVLVDHALGRVGLAVDGLQGESQVVIKPLGRPLESTPGFAGSTILGDGRVALILDVDALVSSWVPAASAATTRAIESRRFTC
jgi:two-component system chemotaxis sensor kinase CheA